MRHTLRWTWTMMMAALAAWTTACSDEGGGDGDAPSLDTDAQPADTADSAAPGTETDTADSAAQEDTGASLYQRWESAFPVGVAIEPRHLDMYPEIIDAHFNHITAENAMKWSSLHPAEDTWNWSAADRLADYARDRGIAMTGHTLVWHRQVPSWVFDGLTPGDAADIEILKQRMKTHIETVVARYHDVVDNWDVVNEAIADNGDAPYRTGADDSKWFSYFDGPEYILWAFQVTKDALEAVEPGYSQGKLYYNDYNVNLKADKILQMLAWLEDNGMKIDGVGFQSHIRTDWPSTAEIEATIEKFTAAGYKVKISEIDMTVYNDYPPPNYTYSPEAEKPFTDDLAQEQADKYRKLFDMFAAHADDITSVTFWGVSDDQSWLNTASRPDYPLLFDHDHQPKPALEALLAP